MTVVAVPRRGIRVVPPGVGRHPPCGAVGSGSTRSIGRAHWKPPTATRGERLPESGGRGPLFGSRRCSLVVGMIAGASGPRLVQYAIMGAIVGTAGELITVHSYVEERCDPPGLLSPGNTGHR